MPVPERIQPKSLGDYLEIMTKAVFQSGISWKVVEAKWPGIKEAFQDFDSDIVAGFSEPELDDLCQDTRVIRNRRKLSAIVSNTQRMVELDEEHGGFQKYLRSHPDFSSTAAFKNTSGPTLISHPRFRTSVNSSSSWETRELTSSYTW